MSIELTVVTPEGQAFREDVTSVVLPGTEGDFGVLEDHEIFLTGLRIGEMRIERQGETLYAALSKGFADVRSKSVSVMVGSCEFAHEIDAERAEIAVDRARKQLEEMRATEEVEETYQAYQDAYSRAISRVGVSTHKD
jgi:F-type H+-transporting ATPase subunit epsilon